MDKAAAAVLQEYEARMERESALWRDDPGGAFARRDEMLLPVGRATAELMTIVIAASKPRIILEIGTSYGYSTLWLGEAAKNAGGTLHTLEIAQHKSDYARERVTRAGLAESVVFHVGEARELIAQLKGPFDFVLLDLWKDLYIPCFDLVYPKLSRGAFIVADNMLEPPPVRRDAEAYRKHVYAKKGISSVMLPVGSGIELSRFD